MRSPPDRPEPARLQSRNFPRRAHGLATRALQLMPDVQAKLGETWIRSHSVGIAWPSERHVQHFLDAARTRTHHRDAIAEQNRLVDGVGDEHHGLALVRPLHKREQLVLPDLARLRIE